MTVNTEDMQVNDILLIMDGMVIIQLNETEKLFLYKGDKIKRGKMPFETSGNEGSIKDLEEVLKTINHKDDWMSLMYAEMIRTKIIPEIERESESISYQRCYADNGLEH